MVIIFIFTFSVILGPVVFYAYSRNSKRQKTKIYGCYFIGAYFVMLGFFSFKVAFDGVNTAGSAFVPLFVYATY